jgi:hypothetical protein
MVRLRRLTVAFTALALALAGAAVFVFLSCNPRDWVTAHFLNVPPGTSFLCVVADVDGRATPLNWYLAHFGPFTAPATERFVPYPDGGMPPYGAPVEWKFGRRYGVVVRGPDGWSVRWYDQKDVPLLGRGLLTGRGDVLLDLARQPPEPLTKEDVGRMGLGGVTPDGP